MTAQRVLSAAAALGEFTLDQIEAFCDENPATIVGVLDRAGGVAWFSDESPTGGVWRVVDHERLRESIQLAPNPDVRGRADSDRRMPALSSTVQLQYAEQTLVESGGPHTMVERRILLGTAQNHLRQVVSKTINDHSAWFEIELEPPALEARLADETDVATRTRLQLDIEVAYLAEHELTGKSLATQDLVASISRIQPLISFVDRRSMANLVGRFFDLVLAQAVPSQDRGVEEPARLLAALARRRIREQLDRSIEGAMRSLVPLLTNVGRDDGDRPPELYEVLEDLGPEGQHVVVSSDLLELLPAGFGWKGSGVRLPGTLIEAVAQSDTSAHLKMCARTLERDLFDSPYKSELALIGSAVHVFQRLAAQSADFDRSLSDRSDRTCSELLRLARVAMR